MGNNAWIEKARKDLNTLLGKLSFNDYYVVNFKNGKKRRKKHIPYSLSEETLRCRDLYNKVYGKKEVSKEIEEEIKTFLLPYRMGKREITL